MHSQLAKRSNINFAYHCSSTLNNRTPTSGSHVLCSYRHVTAIIAPKVALSATTALRPHPLVSLVIKGTAFICVDGAGADSLLVVNDRRRQLLVAVTSTMGH